AGPGRLQSASSSVIRTPRLNGCGNSSRFSIGPWWEAYHTWLPDRPRRRKTVTSLDTPRRPLVVGKLPDESCRVRAGLPTATHSTVAPRVIVRRTAMTIEALIVWLVIGAVAGWLAGQIMKGYGFGLVGNIVVGIVGAVIAGWLLPRIGFVLVGGIVAAVINAVIGAVILLAVIGLFKKAT